MSAGILLIDGYNLMHAAGMAQHDYKPGELLKCRTRLLRFLLGKLTAAEISAATIVFDARDPPPDRPAQVVVSGLKVLFANPGGDADVVIQQWLARHSSPRRVMLVSSDRVLQRAARGCRAKFVGSEEFLEDLERRRTPRGKAASGRVSSGAAHADDSKPASHLSSSHTAYWLKVFGEAPPVVVEEEVQAGNSTPPPTARPKPAAGATRAASRSHNTSPSRRAPRDDTQYWLQVFGGLSADSIDSSPDELRLADLENWLKAFQAGNP